jgi:hypothetical protein
MRMVVALWLLAFAGAGIGAEQQRSWKDGTWGPRDERQVIVETDTQIISGQPVATAPPRDWSGEPGSTVRYAIDGSTLYVLDEHGQEHALTLGETAAKYTSDYGAVGSGHFIKTVARGGVAITLEDGSRWDIEPRQHFAVAGWQADDLITVRRSTDDPAFVFELDNTTQDDGALANRRAR